MKLKIIAIKDARKPGHLKAEQIERFIFGAGTDQETRATRDHIKICPICYWALRDRMRLIGAAKFAEKVNAEMLRTK